VSTEESTSSDKPESGPSVFKAIVAIGLMGPQDDVERFVAMWVTQCERRAHLLQSSFPAVNLLPLPEDENEVQ
jgi:hypothetical protein